MLSVVIPSLNEADSLPACLSSIMAQETADPFEVVVVDNGSIDGTARLAEASGARVLVCLQRGVVYARQAGLEAAKGDVVVQIDADSCLAPGALKIIEDAFIDPQVVAVLGHVVYWPGTWLSKIMEIGYLRSNTLTGRWLKRPIFVLAGALSCRRAALLAEGGYRTDLPHSGDEFGILRQLGRQGKILWAPAVIIGTSDRRFRGRVLRFLLVDLLGHTILDRLVYRVGWRSMFGRRADVR